MDFGTLATVIVTLALAGLGGVVWLVRLEGRVNLLQANLTNEADLRKALESRISGFEQRIYEQLETIISKLDRKADKT